MSHNLKNKLDQEHLEFDTSAAWEQLSPKLESSKRKRRGLMWWWISGSGVAVLLIFATLYIADRSDGFLKQQKLSEQLDTHLLHSEGEVSPSKSTTTVVLGSTKEFANETNAEEHNSGLRNELTLSGQSDATIGTADEMNSHEVFMEESGPGLSGIGSHSIQGVNQKEVPRQIQREKIELTEFSSEISPGNPVLELVAEISEAINGSKAQTSIEKDPAWMEIDYLKLSLLESIDEDEELGPLPTMPKSRIPYGKLRTKPYWQVGVLAGAGHELLKAEKGEFGLTDRTPLELKTLQVGLTRSFSKRLAISVNGQLVQRKELWRTENFLQLSESVFNPSVLLVGGERFGDSVQVVSEQRTDSERYATFTRLNVGAVVEYLIPTRSCDYAVYGGVNYALLQRWTGSRMEQPEDFAPIVEDKRGPYSLTEYPSRLSYVIGTRASKSIGSQLQLLFDTRVTLNSRYQIDAVYDGVFSETGHAVTVSLGLGWRFE